MPKPPESEHQWLGFDGENGDSERTAPVDASIDTPSRRVNLEARYNQDNQSVEGFCPIVVDSPDQYMDYLDAVVFPLVDANQSASRISNRVVMKQGLRIPFDDGKYILHRESRIPLGGKWEGYDFVMNGTNMPGRRLSPATINQLYGFVIEAKKLHPYAPPKPLPLGFTQEHLTMEQVTLEDLDDLVDLFGQEYSSNVINLQTLSDLQNWVRTPDAFPVVIRDNDGQIISVAMGIMSAMNFGDRLFEFFEITDTATHPAHKGQGLNRRIKHYLIALAAQFGADSIHTETRAAVKGPNQSAYRNGMSYHQTLTLDKRSSGGPVDFDETQDPGLTPEARQMSSSNVWAITPDSTWWSYYEHYLEKKPRRAFV